MTPETADTGFDPVDLAVLSSRFTAIVRSMSNTLIRSGRSVILNSGRDFSCSIITADDELFSFAESIPVHVLSGPDLMSKSMKEFHPGVPPGRCVRAQLAVPRQLPPRRHVHPGSGLRRRGQAPLHAAQQGPPLGHRERRADAVLRDGAGCLRGRRRHLAVRQGAERLPGHRRRHPHVPGANPRT